jgi:hypothetical protein
MTSHKIFMTDDMNHANRILAMYEKFISEKKIQPEKILSEMNNRVFPNTV